MIEGRPGSSVPRHLNRAEMTDDIVKHLDKGWDWILLLGPPGCGKTSLGLVIMDHLWRKHREISAAYWTEQDYLADLKHLWRLEEMTKTLSPKADALWSEYIEWEREFGNLKHVAALFLDDLCRAYTPMQWHEIEELVRYRYNEGLFTVAAVENRAWDDAPHTLKSLLDRDSKVIIMEDR